MAIGRMMKAGRLGAECQFMARSALRLCTTMATLAQAPRTLQIYQPPPRAGYSLFQCIARTPGLWPFLYQTQLPERTAKLKACIGDITAWSGKADMRWLLAEDPLGETIHNHVAELEALDFVFLKRVVAGGASKDELTAAAIQFAKGAASAVLLGEALAGQIDRQAPKVIGECLGWTALMAACLLFVLSPAEPQ